MKSGLDLNYIAQRRKELGLKQADVAGCIGMSNISYCKYENGVSKFNAEIIPKLAKALNIPIEKMFCEEEEEPEEEKTITFEEQKEKFAMIAGEQIMLLAEWNKKHIDDDAAQVAENVDVIRGMLRLFLCEV